MSAKPSPTKCLVIIIVTTITGLGLKQLLEFAFSVSDSVESSPAITVSTIDSNAAKTKQLNSSGMFEQIKINEPQHTIESQINETHLNLILVGLVQSNHEIAERAIILFEKKENSYSAGARLPGKNNVFLSKIMNDYVIINNDGHEELLRLYNPNASISSQANLPAPADAPKDTPSVYGPPDGYNEAQTIQPNERDEELALVDINRNLMSVVAMSIQRLESNKQLIGYRIHPGYNINKFNASGLNTDDMITAINGIPLTKPNEILESYKSHEGAPITLEIERGESVITVELNQTL